MLNKVISFAGIILLLLPLSAMSAQDENGNNWISENGKYQVSYKSDLNPIVINRIHSWTLHVTDTSGTPVDGAQIAVKGGMPAHNHGLATQPTVEPLGDGDYQLQGLRFHMMGYWELELTITSNGTSDRVVIKLEL